MRIRDRIRVVREEMRISELLKGTERDMDPAIHRSLAIELDALSIPLTAYSKMIQEQHPESIYERINRIDQRIEAQVTLYHGIERQNKESADTINKEREQRQLQKARARIRSMPRRVMYRTAHMAYSMVASGTAMTAAGLLIYNPSNTNQAPLIATCCVGSVMAAVTGNIGYYWVQRGRHYEAVARAEQRQAPFTGEFKSHGVERNEN